MVESASPALQHSQGEKEVSGVDMRVTVTLLRGHKHGRGERRMEGESNNGKGSG